jgi:nitrogen-specific signal transduction histidine kinase
VATRRHDPSSEAGPNAPKRDTAPVPSGIAPTRRVEPTPEQLLSAVLGGSKGEDLEERLLHIQKMDVAGRLGGGIVHDFNNLLTVILGEVAVAQSNPARAAEALEEIRRCAERAGALTRQLLAFSRRRANRPEVFPVKDLVSETVEMLRRLIGEDIELNVRISDDTGCVSADRAQLEQVLVNLAVNARDAMPEGGRLDLEGGRAQIGPDDVDAPLPPGDYVEISVVDSGTGMTEEVKARVFEPFFTTKERGSGTGLGLAISHEIVQQSGGQIVLESAIGAGTRLRVFLPRVEGWIPRSRRGAAAGPGRGTETLLIVEDDPHVRAITATTLRDYGYAVLEAPNAAAALMLLDGHAAPIHLVLTDVLMPGGRGSEISDAVRRRRPDAKVLLLSGYPEEVLARRAPLPENVPLLQKPYTPAELVARVRQVLDEG